jgi:FkbM family methyltransferase
MLSSHRRGNPALTRVSGRIRDRSPLWFRVARSLPVKRATTRRWLEYFGALNDAVPVRWHDGTVFMPMGERVCWKYADLGEIDLLSTDNLAKLVRARFNRWTMVDCGANCGLFTLSIARKAPGLDHVIAIEPNANYIGVLRRNLALLTGTTAEIHAGAVSDYTGLGRLVAPDYDSNPHGWFVTPDPAGDIEVTRLDDISGGDGANLVIKFDIEGDEFQALRGARALLGAAAAFILFVEFHGAVLARTGIEPRAVFDLVASIRPTRWVDAEAPDHEIDITRPVLEQTLNHQICDVIGLPA